MNVLNAVNKYRRDTHSERYLLIVFRKKIKKKRLEMGLWRIPNVNLAEGHLCFFSTMVLERLLKSLCCSEGYMIQPRMRSRGSILMAIFPMDWP